MVRVAINGLGRIGRHAAKLLVQDDSVQLVAINDLAPAESLQYLMRYDSVYGRYDVELEGGELVFGGQRVQVLNAQDPAALPWGELGIDVVIEATGAFTKGEEAAKHIQAGAKAVVISAPSKGDQPAPTVIRGVNDQTANGVQVVNNGSCTTNCIAPVIQVLQNAFGVDKALMTTVHGYTSSQALVDGPNAKDPRRGRAAAINIIPTSTGAAKATTEAIPALGGKFDGMALRIPLVNGSIADITAVLGQEVTVEQVNDAFRAAADDERYAGVLTVTDDPMVSSDVIGDPHSAVVDLGLTKSIGNLVKVFAWYDNEFAYAHRLVELALQQAE